jgi:hypothetical protein
MAVRCISWLAGILALSLSVFKIHPTLSSPPPRVRHYPGNWNGRVAGSALVRPRPARLVPDGEHHPKP